jgi:hypothetical protein
MTDAGLVVAITFFESFARALWIALTPESLSQFGRGGAAAATEVRGIATMRRKKVMGTL